MSRLRFFGVNASGAYIALFGGLMAAQHGGVVGGFVGDVISRRGTKQCYLAGAVLSPVRAWRSRLLYTDRSFYGRGVHSSSVYEAPAKMDCHFRSRLDRDWCVELV